MPFAIVTALALMGCPARGPSGPTRNLVVKPPTPLEVAGGAIAARILLDAPTVGCREASLVQLTISPETKLPAHVHPTATEVVYVLAGQGDVTLSGTRQHVGAGDSIAIPPGVVHGFDAGAEAVTAVQFYLPGGPEQRYRGQDTVGTVKPEESPVPDPGGARVVSAAKARKLVSSGKSYVIPFEELPVTGGGKIDLLTVTKPAGQAADVHDHDDLSELIYIVRGSGTVTIDGDDFEVAAGDGYYTPMGSSMGSSAHDESELLVLAVYPPG